MKGSIKKGKKGFIIWSSVCGFLLVLFLIITIVATAVMPDIIGSVMGRDRAVYADGVTPLYESNGYAKADILKKANELNQKVCEEGFVLLKNKQTENTSALPLKGSEGISVFGKNSVNLAYGGSGSSAGDSSSVVDLYKSLEEAGFKTNPKLKSFYSDKGRSGSGRSANSSDLDNGDSVFYSTGETPQSKYTGNVELSATNYTGYTDVALIVFTRIGGEGFDLPRSMKGVEGARNESDHYLQLDQNETDLLKAVCGSGIFGKVVVVINSGSPMELAFLEKEDYYAYQNNIDAAIWMGFPGGTGALALGRILNGEVNPSGRLVDTYSADFKKDPTWNNFGDYLQYGEVSGDRYLGTGNDKYYFVDYEENIYIGYRYYETRYAAEGDEWYKNNVVYPFGYGMSYTSFNWEIEDDKEINGVTLSDYKEGDSYTIKVKVTNTGKHDGKEVVELYGHAPYTEGGIEKSELVLLDFAKTKVIKADGKDYDIVELTFDPYYLASYDYKDANKNWESTYELDYGDYALYVSSDAHTKKFTIPFSIEKDIIIGSDPVTGSSVENRYTDVGLDSSDYHLQTLLTRNGWDMPTSPTNEERTIDADFLAALKDTAHNNPNVDSYYEMDKPTFGNTDIPLVLRDLLTYNEDDSFAVDEKGNYVAYDDARWDMLINKLSLSDLKNMCNLGAFKTNALPSIEKPLTNDTDGPTGFTNFMDQTGTYWDTCYYCAEVVMSSTWDAELIEELGATVGEEGFVGSDGKGNNLPYSGWYAPGVNTHRSPFGGRNFEYFSEDGILSGKIAAAEIRGCRSRGVYCFVKHFALNEQETHRSSNGSSTWVTEQAMREIYLKPFELAVKDGGTTAIMSSFNRIGTRWTGGDYRLLTQILRDEWGFNGTVITDFNTTSYMNLKQMAYAGGDLNLGNDMTLIPSLTPDWCKSDDTADLIVLRNNVKNILYTVVNSNAVNGIVDHYIMAWWKILIIVLDCAVVVGAGVWGYFAVRNFLKKEDEA